MEEDKDGGWGRGTQVKHMESSCISVCINYIIIITTIITILSIIIITTTHRHHHHLLSHCSSSSHRFPSSESETKYPEMMRKTRKTTTAELIAASEAAAFLCIRVCVHLWVHPGFVATALSGFKELCEDQRRVLPVG